MPLLNPSQIHAVMREVRGPLDSEEKDLKRLLHENNLSPSEVLDTLASVMRGGENDNTRLRAAETALKLNGMLFNNESPQIPHVTIIINNGDVGAVNPILIPR